MAKFFDGIAKLLIFFNFCRFNYLFQMRCLHVCYLSTLCFCTDHALFIHRKIQVHVTAQFIRLSDVVIFFSDLFHIVYGCFVELLIYISVGLLFLFIFVLLINLYIHLLRLQIFQLFPLVSQLAGRVLMEPVGIFFLSVTFYYLWILCLLLIITDLLHSESKYISYFHKTNCEFNTISYDRWWYCVIIAPSVTTPYIGLDLTFFMLAQWSSTLCIIRNNFPESLFDSCIVVFEGLDAACIYWLPDLHIL